MAAKKMDTKKVARVYMGVSVVAFSAWLIMVAVKLVILAGHFVTSAFSIVRHSLPVLG